MSLLVQKVSNMLLRKSGEIAPERVKGWLSQRGNNTLLWMCLVVKVKSDAVKNSVAKEPGILGPYIKVNCSWSSRRWQIEH